MCALTMNKFTKFLIILLFWWLNGTECCGKNGSDLSTGDKSKVIRAISLTCFTEEACQPECCKYYYLYSVAKKNCTVDIDGQVAAAKWYSPFSKVYHQFWESVCSQNDGSEWKTDMLFTYSSHFVNDTVACRNFDKHCLTFSKRFINLLKCDPSENGISWKTWLPISTTIVSISLQISTLLLFLIVPDLLQSIKDKCFLFYLTTGLIETIIYFTSLFSVREPVDFSCYLVALGGQFLGLASHFWFNVLCFHLWHSLKNITTSHRSPNTILCLYSLYAFGCSLAVSVITYIADRWISYESPIKPIREPYCSIIVHNYALGNAWFQPTFIYYYSIVIILLLIDSAAFFDIARTISAREKRFNGNKDELRRHKKHKLGVSTYLKLFVLMGTINLWSLIIFLFARSDTVRIISSLPIYLNGVFIWFIVICRKQVFHAVKRRFFKLKIERVLSGGTNASQLTHSIKLNGYNSARPKSQSWRESRNVF